MTRKNTIKINQCLKALPRGSVLTTAWLRKHGISSKLAWWYVKSGWLEHISDGAYFLTGDTITWASAVAAIQQQLQLPIHIGAKTALQLFGKSHYLSASLNDVQLFTVSGIKVPAWLKSDYWQESFTVFCTSLFDMKLTANMVVHAIDGIDLQLSTPERAALEICYLVPNVVTFLEAAQIIEGLNRLRPRQVQQMLENCRSLKAKRLLLYFADYFQHGWLCEMNLSNVDLGKGKRVIAGGGQYNKKYKISIPPIDNN